MTTPAATRLTGDLAQASVGVTGSEAQVLGLMEWSIDKKVKTLESTTTDDAGHENALVSTDSWDVSAKFAFIDSDTSQATNIFNQCNSAQSALQWNFFPKPELGRGAFSGKAYVTGYKIAGGVGKIFALDVTLKGVGALTFGVQLAPASGVAQI
jgi:predicted secreted protein